MKTTNMTEWVVQKLSSLIGGALLAASLLMTGHVYAFLIDLGIHPPPTTGPIGYNTFKPGTAGFPALGGIYTDPVFGNVVKRLSNTVGSINMDDIYAHHWGNADGTYAFTKGSAGADIIQVATGAKFRTNQPSGLNHSEDYWDALDPDKYYYFSGASLMQRRLSTQVDTLVKTFPGTLQANGGSLNIQTRDGRYFTVRYGDTNKVWDTHPFKSSGVTAPE